MRTLTSVLLGLLVTAPARSAEIDYRRDVKPILQARCVACHGAVRQKGGLRLDASPLIRKGGKNGGLVAAGKPDASLLLDAVLGRDRPRMPPEDDGAGLSEKEVAVLRAWIEQGAAMPDEPIPDDPRKHWAFQPPVRAAVPGQGGGNVVDAFLAAERAKAGTTANGLADKATLLRRVTLDLVGVPPTPDELHAFLADGRPDAYERVVDRLLADPRHGERWGRHWMDVWRYSDPFGLGEEYRYSQRHIWRWRDWIVESLNADKGYDRMVREQLAGDEVAPADPDTLRATGYLARNWYKFNRNVWLADTVEYTAAGFLGLTFRCARCHDHKYDPISQQDYYQLRAFFEPHDVRIDRVAGQADPLKDGVARAFDAKPDAPTYLFRRGDERQPDTSRKLLPALPPVLGGPTLAIGPVQYTPADHRKTLGPAVEEAERLAQAETAKVETEVANALTALDAATRRRDRLALGEKVEADAPWLHDTFAKKTDAWKVVSGQWAWEGSKLVGKAPGAFSTVSLTKDHPANLMGRVRYKTTGGAIGSVGFSYDVAGNNFQAVYINANANSAVRPFHRVNGTDTYPNDVVPHPVKFGQEVTLDFAVRGDRLNTWVDGKLCNVYKLPRPRQVGTFTLWTHEATVEFLELRLSELPASVALAEKPGDAPPSPLAGPVALTVEDAEKAVTRAEQAVKSAGQRREIARLGVEAVAARAVAETAKYAEPRDEAAFQAAAKAAGKLERTAAVLNAKLVGDAKKVADAEAALVKDEPTYTPLVRLDASGTTGRRLALANWIVDRSNPLAARVAVNHVWMRHFGTPLVPTPGNLGLAGGKPTHPALLDWLAVEFMESGWSMKRLHRLLVTSDAYRMSSAPSPSRERDADNRTLWRMNPRRMEAEVVRDSLLSLAGQLDPTMGGPILDVKLGEMSRRRSVYFRFNTEYQVGFLEPFDLASPTECYRRHESVAPQQALALFNSALTLNQSRQLAKRLAALEAEPFVVAAYEAILSRPPTPAERERCAAFLREQAALYAKPGPLTPFPPAAGTVTPPATDPAQRAREDLLGVLFNHNDFVTIR